MSQFTLKSINLARFAAALAFLASSGASAAAVCPPPNADPATLDITVPCVMFNQQRYQAKLLQAPNAAGGIAWVLDPATAVGQTSCTASVPYCGLVDANLGITLRDVVLNGVPYTLRLGLSPGNAAPPSWSYVGHHQSIQHAKVGPTCKIDQGKQTISFVHVGDLHANFDLVKDKYSRIRGFFEKVRKENPYTIFTNAGDDHEKGSIAEQYSRGVAVTEAIRAMQFDVRTIGNHDFAWGDQHVLDFSRDPYSLVLLSNIQYVGSDPQGLGSVEYGVVELGCLRVGFFGLVSPPWDELDHTYETDYFPTMKSTYDNAPVARRIVEAHRGEVDLMVMVSHLGIEEDIKVAQNVAGIDLVMGGHSHYGTSLQKINDTQIVQPDFYADGVTRIDMEIDLATRKILSFKRQEQPVKELTEVDPAIHQAIGAILTKYAPDARKPIAYLEYAQDVPGMVRIAAKAGIQQHLADAALLDPQRVSPYYTWSPGEVSAQTLLDSYFVERQKPDTPGINAFYMVEVSGENLRLMQAQQPKWVYVGPTTPDPKATYKVIIHKAGALNPGVFFPSTVSFNSVTLKSEAWEALTKYAADRTANCLSLDTDTLPPPCRKTAAYSSWAFSDSANPLRAAKGSATLGYFDPKKTGWAAGKVVFGNTSALSLPALTNGHKPVMSFPAANPDEGLVLTHNEAPNGYFSAKGLVSNYTLVMDVLWPSASAGKWRALLQTSPTNSDDADWYVDSTPQGGIGVSRYFGAVPADSWHRIALVARAAESGGTLQFFVDGQFVGEVANAGQRWALEPSALLFTENSYETEKGYVANIIFAGFAMTHTEIQALGKAAVSP